MMRKCDGTDPNLITIDRKPCTCGREFDDVDYEVVYPHRHVLTEEEKEILFKTFDEIGFFG